MEVNCLQEWSRKSVQQGSFRFRLDGSANRRLDGNYVKYRYKREWRWADDDTGESVLTGLEDSLWRQFTVEVYRYGPVR